MAKKLTYTELEEAIRDGLDLLNNMHQGEIVCLLCGVKETNDGGLIDECPCDHYEVEEG